MKKMAIVTLGLFLLVTLGACTKIQSTNTTGNNTSTKADPLAEVKKHNTASDCWMIIEGLTYNVTDYIPSHPAGETILAGCGTDATDMYNGIAKHAGKAQNLLSKYLVK